LTILTSSSRFISAPVGSVLSDCLRNALILGLIFPEALATWGWAERALPRMMVEVLVGRLIVVLGDVFGEQFG
jgi:hypothetical protein